MGQGVTGISIVGVCHNRSRELIVSVPGILKVGAAYSPLDAAYPHERLNRMMAQLIDRKMAAFTKFDALVGIRFCGASLWATKT